MLTISSGHAHDILAVVASGRINHEDVEGYLVPAIEAKLQDHASIRLWYEFSPEFEGISVAALWDDAVLGLFHLSDFSRVVMIANQAQTSAMVNALACMLPCPVKVFAADEQTQAKAWLDQ
ncbi:SpoIIAA family protein [Shewanella baltica]|uniref:STAS/SEC14 domain-containing protein n=1 Tax=Shewanella baltica TaxID=62322 RepID=UPI00217D29DD|nr:STAS/SEC14 domain-containing protein [Shewanella baltica]MCS6121978.1 STAS/SEC14 domain-containing protein [Shewanella baltica]